MEVNFSAAGAGPSDMDVPIRPGKSILLQGKGILRTGSGRGHGPFLMIQNQKFMLFSEMVW